MITMNAPHDPLTADQTWQGLAVGVLGLGSSGLAVGRLLLHRGARVRGFDDRAASDFDVDLLREFEGSLGVSYAGSALEVEDLDALILSPGVPREHAVVQAALANHCVVLRM